MSTRLILIASLSLFVMSAVPGSASESAQETLSFSNAPVHEACGLGLFSEPRMMSSTSSLSCADECNQAALTCTSQCGATQAECDAATQICFDSCWRGVGPWLPC